MFESTCFSIQVSHVYIWLAKVTSIMVVWFPAVSSLGLVRTYWAAAAAGGGTSRRSRRQAPCDPLALAAESPLALHHIILRKIWNSNQNKTVVAANTMPRWMDSLLPWGYTSFILGFKNTIWRVLLNNTFKKNANDCRLRVMIFFKRQQYLVRKHNSSL